MLHFNLILQIVFPIGGQFVWNDFWPRYKPATCHWRLSNFNLTFGPRLNSASHFDSLSNRASKWFPIYLECLRGTDRVLQLIYAGHTVFYYTLLSLLGLFGEVKILHEIKSWPIHDLQDIMATIWATQDLWQITTGKYVKVIAVITKARSWWTTTTTQTILTLGQIHFE